ncbi:hypothetical protein SAMN05421796_102392 [Chryseobacterium piscicola]|uniref:Uncharacterized protein n=1 Tax=Chryseobacterium piscicola TaxID=551459 RepID=A0A1N7LK73_9FLAO|nr:hypothetical protein [Chryseobacterium piscicola]PQA97689.1 hypothetical protein B0A70_03255 [Chryseobacterium piscicola]SIS74238.1 hypothetical protein SAMN05421796_102392 [Chryseobacterium piscicola]
MQKINKFNQFLLEKYPTIWNTKIVWMLLAGIIVHLLFFIIGYVSYINPKSLQTTNVTDDYYRDGIILVHLIISILMIVGWLIMMFKNNAFKNFYPNSKGKLFSQFFQYFVIIFVCTTFYFSYMIGFKMFINSKYPDTEMKANIETINRGNAFLSQNLELYTLDNRLSPQPFFDLYCETDIKKVDRTKKYFVFYNRVYQYYSVYSKTSYQKDYRKDFIIPQPEKAEEKEVIYSEKDGDKSETFYFKKNVVDVSQQIKFEGVSFYNFSELFYEDKSRISDYSNINYYEKNSVDSQNISLKKKKAEINRKTAELLDKNSPAEIEQLLSRFLKISNQFAIENNLDAKQWMKMVYSPTNFNVRYFIKKYKPSLGQEYDPNNSEDYDNVALAADSAVSVADAAIVNKNGEIVNDSILIKDFNPEINKQISPEDYFKKNTTDYYYYTDNLKDFLTSVDDVKSYDFFSQNIHIYLWIAFFLATFILSFRITGLKSLLFSIISAGVLTLLVTLIVVLYAVSVSGKEEFFVAYLVFIISVFILSVPIFAMNKFNKLITSLFVNISLNGFVLFVLLLFGIVTIHQKEACKDIDGYCQTIMDSLGLGLSYIILICGFLFMFFYTKVLLNWKARPE